MFIKCAVERITWVLADYFFLVSVISDLLPVIRSPTRPNTRSHAPGHLSLPAATSTDLIPVLHICVCTLTPPTHPHHSTLFHSYSKTLSRLSLQCVVSISLNEVRSVICYEKLVKKKNQSQMIYLYNFILFLICKIHFCRSVKMNNSILNTVVLYPNKKSFQIYPSVKCREEYLLL